MARGLKAQRGATHPFLKLTLTVNRLRAGSSHTHSEELGGNQSLTAKKNGSLFAQERFSNKLIKLQTYRDAVIWIDTFFWSNGLD